MSRSRLNDSKPVLAMVVVQSIYAGLALSAKATFDEGMSSMVFVVYRQAIATVVLVPTAILANGGRTNQLALGLKGLAQVFFIALLGLTINQYFYYKGIDLSSPAMATAMTNLIPAITFVMAASLGLEEVNMRSLRTIAKILGTIICIGGAVTMALYKGPQLFNMEHPLLTSILHSFKKPWLIGCLFLMGSNCCWSLWLVTQVSICKHYLDPLSLSAWMCFLATFQSAIITLITEPDLNAWKIDSFLKLGCCLFAGIFGSGVTVFLQAWSIAIKGPLFSALFNPLSAVITAILGFLLLHEVLYVGSMIGAASIVAGLYIVLWGKAKDLDTKSEPHPTDGSPSIRISVEPPRSGCESDLQEPLLA